MKTPTGTSRPENGGAPTALDEHQPIPKGMTLSTYIRDRFEEFAVGKPQLHIESRAHLIAVTEVGEAYSAGSLAAGEALEEAGVAMEKSWSTVGDDRVSAGCLGNEDAGWIPLNDDFPSGHQRPLRFPGCRCDLLMQAKED